METAEKTTWNIDPDHSEIGFKVKHMMISTVSGNFDNFEGSLKSADDSFKDADFDFSAEIQTINTKNKDRDTHLKSDDFFHAEKFPKLRFKSKSFDGSTLVGDLTIRDVTKEISLETDFNGVAVDPYGRTKAGFEMTGSINRKDFGLTYNAVTEAGNVMVGDKIRLAIDAQFIKKQ